MSSAPEKPWTMELSKLTVHRSMRDGREGLLVTAMTAPDAVIYCFVPLATEEARATLIEGNMTFVLNVMAADLTNAFNSILWMWNHPEEAEKEGYMDPDSSTKIRAWRDKAGLQ